MTNHDNAFRFQDRSEAGAILGNRLKPYARLGDTLVLALPRGGVPVGAEIARALSAPLFVFIVRKLGVPGHEELAIGSVTSGGSPVIDTNVASKLHLSERLVNSIVRREQRRLSRSQELYSLGRKSPDPNNKIVILADDGATTGSTLALAVEAIRQQGAAQVIVAVPVAASSAVSRLNKSADQVVCLMEPKKFVKVSQWYQDFDQPSERQVCQMLERSAGSMPEQKTA